MQIMGDGSAGVVVLGDLGPIGVGRVRVLDAIRINAATLAAYELPDRDYLICVGAAALALAIDQGSKVWAPSCTLRQAGGDVIAWGELVIDELARSGKVRPTASESLGPIGDAALEVIRWVTDDLLAQRRETDRALGPSGPATTQAPDSAETR